MRELLTRTGDYGAPAAEARVRGHPPRHARAIYLCSPAATGVVGRARDALGADGARIEIRALPPGAAGLPAPGPRRDRPLAGPGAHPGRAPLGRAASPPSWSTAAVLVAAAPVTLVAAGQRRASRGCAAGRRAGCCRAAAWLLPMVVTWLAGIAVARHQWRPVAAGALPGLAGHVAAGRGRAVPARRGADRAGRDPARPGRGRRGLGGPAAGHGVRGGRGRAELGHRVRPASVAASGRAAPGPGSRRRARCR